MEAAARKKPKAKPTESEMTEEALAHMSHAIRRSAIALESTARGFAYHAAQEMKVAREAADQAEKLLRTIADRFHTHKAQAKPRELVEKMKTNRDKGETNTCE